MAFGAYFEILLAIANIATAVVGLISLMSVITLRQDLAGGGGNSESDDVVGQSHSSRSTSGRAYTGRSSAPASATGSCSDT